MLVYAIIATTKAVLKPYVPRGSSPRGRTIEREGFSWVSVFELGDPYWADQQPLGLQSS